jgi:hypothetical protein
MKVIIAKFSKVGNENHVFDLTPEEIKQKKIEGCLIKQYLPKTHYRPGFYTTKKQFLEAPGTNF